MKTTQIRIIVAVIALCLLFTSCMQQPVESETPSPTALTAAPTAESTAEPTETTPVAIDTGKYTIYWENEKCYIAFPPVDPNDTKEQWGYVAAQYPKFSSVQEMKKKLSEGDISEAEIEELRRATQQGTYAICNINDLYEAVLPEDVEQTMVRFLGTAYDFTFRGSEEGVMVCVSEDVYESEWNRHYKGTNLSKGCILLLTETVADRNAEVRHYTYAGTESKQVFYTYETAHGQQRVYEMYIDGNLSTIYIFGESNGSFYIVSTSSDMLERPSIDWMSSFYLKKFIETEVS